MSPRCEGAIAPSSQGGRVGREGVEEGRLEDTELTCDEIHPFLFLLSTAPFTSMIRLDWGSGSTGDRITGSSTR